MRHGHTLARERFFKDINDLLREIIAPINAKRKRQGERPFTERSWIEHEFGKSMLVHYDTLHSSVKDGEHPELKERAWYSFKDKVLSRGDETKVKLLQDRFANYTAAHTWGRKVRIAQKVMTFDALRDGIAIEKLKDPAEFERWFDRLDRSRADQEQFLVRCYAVAEGISKYRKLMGLEETDSFVKRLSYVWFNAAMCAIEQEDNIAFVDCMLKFDHALELLPFPRFINGQIAQGLEYLINKEPLQTILHLLLESVMLRLGIESVTSDPNLNLFVAAETCRVAVFAWNKLEYSDGMKIRLGKVTNELIIKNWLTLHKNDGFFEESADLWRSNPQYRSYVESYKSGDFIREMSMPPLMECADIRYDLAYASALLEWKVREPDRARAILEGSLMTSEIGVIHANMPAVVDWYDTCAKFFIATGYGWLGARAHDCIEDIYLKRGQNDKVDALRMADVEASNMRPYADAEPDKIGKLRDAVLNRTLVKLVT